MNYEQYLAQIIDEGVAAAKTDYTEERNKDKLKGSVEGFEACRGKSPAELKALLGETRERVKQAYLDEAENYFEIRCYEAEVEWVCNCVNAILMNEGQPIIVSPTARGMMKAAEVVGVRERQA
jgi:hypothetical protein